MSKSFFYEFLERPFGKTAHSARTAKQNRKPRKKRAQEAQEAGERTASRKICGRK
jgi:hypothetical protein